MKLLIGVLVLAAALPAVAQEKGKKDEKKEDKKAAAAGPATPESLMREAEQKAAAGDKDGAAEVLRRAAAMPAATGDVSMRLGRLLEGKYEFDAAIDAYKAAADKLTGPAKGEALGRTAVLQQVRGMPEAAATAKAAGEADPQGVWPIIAKSRALAREGKADEAVALAQQVAATGGAAAASALGYAQEAKGDLAGSEASYRAAMNDPEQKAIASVGLARVLRKTGRAAEAEPILKKAIEDAPGAVEAYKESARVKIALNRASEAVGDAATAAALAEGDAEAQRLVQEVGVAQALGYLATNQPDLAIQDLTKLRDQHDTAEVRVGLARAHIAKREPDLALPELQKAVELDPTSADAQYQLGFVQHVMKRNPAAAVPAYEKAVAADPANVEYRTQLGAALAAANQSDRAIEELTKVTATPGYKRAEAWIYLGQANLVAKKYKDSIAALDKASTIVPDNVQVETFLAWSYFGLKDSKSFVDHGRKARTLGQKDATLLDYLARVEKGEPIK
jgi:tetratricopeptide (TPR) repeat protein